MLSRESLEPDVLIVDLAMPGMDGGSFIEALRRIPAMTRSPIFVISAFGEAEAPSPSGVRASEVQPSRDQDETCGHPREHDEGDIAAAWLGRR